jgi:hypothetical protein
MQMNPRYQKKPRLLLLVMKKIILGLLFLTSSLLAQTVPFETAADLTAFTTTISSNATMSQNAAVGAGNPATGGAKFQGDSGATDRGAVSYKTHPGNGTTFGSYSASVLVNMREANDTIGASNIDKHEVRIGFSTDTVTGSKPWEFFHKNNPSISLLFKAENKPADGKVDQLGAEISSRTTVETKYGAVAQNNSVYFNDWLRITLNVIRTSASTFSVSYTVDSLGADGAAAPVNVFTSSSFTATNANFGSASTVYHGFTSKTEAGRNSSLYVDDFLASTTASAPAVPTATAATAVNANGLTANWSAGSGVAATSYTLEVSTQANNFAAGTFISATGVGGQSSGILINNAAAVSQVITGLSPLQTYVYRVIATNSVGSSAVSNVISASTPNTNAPPTLNAIADQGPIASYAAAIALPLSGISAGGESGQTVSLTVSSSNTSIIPTPTLSYTAPASTATLTYDPTGTVGSATITVTVNDGQAQNNITTRSFVITVNTPPVTVNFNSNTDLNLFNITTASVTNTYEPAAGVNGGAGIRTQNVSSGIDSGTLFLRSQTYPSSGVTEYNTSVMVNLSELDDITTGTRKGEARIGLSATNSVSSSRPDEFFHKNNDSFSVVLKGEHSVTDPAANRKLECELFNRLGVESKAAKITLNSQGTALNNWLRLSMKIIPLGSDQFLCSYKLEDMGATGTAVPTTVMASSSVNFTNATMATATALYAGYIIKPDKATPCNFYSDDHSVSVSTDLPAVPTATTANRVTTTSFNANWTPGTGAFATAWVVEVVRSNQTNFGPNNFIGVNGDTSQSSGITVNSNSIRTLRISGLLANTGYKYRVRAINLNGSSVASNVITVNTLTTGTNAAPTIDAIPNPAQLAINSGEQIVNLTGISDGGELNQTITLSVSSSNTALIPTPTRIYASPASTGTLSFTPNPGITGSSNITVTANDGGANNASFSRSFTVTIVAPNPLIQFDAAADLSLLNITNNSITTSAHAATGGIGGTGAIVVSRSTAGEPASAAIRPTAYDISSAGYLAHSVRVRFPGVKDTTSKDKGEVRLGFMTEGTANALNIKETMHKTTGNNSIGVVFKAEHEPAKPDKIHKLEAELFTGPSDTKAGKVTLLNQAAIMDHWFQVNVYYVRNSLSSFCVTYVIEDWGATGTTYVGEVLASGPHLFTNAALASDNAGYAAWVLSGDASGSNSMYVDRSEVIVNTTAPHAPLAQLATNLEYNSFTANWTPATTGPEADGWIIELIPANSTFATGNYISATGVLNQTNPIYVTDPFAYSVAISGLSRQTSYRYQVSGYINTENGPVKNSVTAITPYGPGLEYSDWRTLKFGSSAGDNSIAGEQADPDKDGMNNLLEYAFDLNPNASDAHLLPQPDVSGPYLRLTYKRRHNIQSYLYYAEATSTLGAADWHSEEVVEVSVSAPDANGMETVVVEDLFPKTVNPRRFMRVAIESLLFQ